MTLKEVLNRFESLGNEKVRAHNSKFGAGPNQYGVRMGVIMALAFKSKSNQPLGNNKDYPVSKGCTSPYAPVWINEMVKRQK